MPTLRLKAFPEVDAQGLPIHTTNNLMNVIDTYGTILGWATDRGLAYVPQARELPPEFNANGASDKGIPSPHPGLYLTLGKKGAEEIGFWFSAYGAKQAWSVAIGKDGNNHIADTVDFINQVELINFLDKQAETILRAA